MSTPIKHKQPLRLQGGAQAVATLLAKRATYIAGQGGRHEPVLHATWGNDREGQFRPLPLNNLPDGVTIFGHQLGGSQMVVFAYVQSKGNGTGRIIDTTHLLTYEQRAALGAGFGASKEIVDALLGNQA